MHVDIRVPYTTRPSMQRRTGPAFNAAPDAAKLHAKQQELDQHGSLLWAETELAQANRLVQRMARHCGKPSVDSIEQLAVSFQEDIAIMQHGVLQAVCFCFPSGWTPRDKIGLSLADIHRPVADNTELVKRSARLAATMTDPVLGRFQRQVWTVTANPALSNLPGTAPKSVPQTIDDLWFRWENQTTEPLGTDDVSLFFVDVNVVPLRLAWPDLGGQIVDSVNSMTDAVLDYKNLRHIKVILNTI